MKNILLIILSTCFLISCNKDSKNKLALGFKIGQPASSWKSTLKDYQNGVLSDTTYNGGSYKLNIGSKDFTTKIELNYDLSPNYELQNEQLIRILLTIDSIDTKTLDTYLKEHLGFDSERIISRINDSITFYNNKPNTNPLLGNYKTKNPLIPTSKNLLELIKENNPNVIYRDLSWTHNENIIGVSYQDWSDQFLIWISSPNEEQIIDSLSKKFIPSYKLSDYFKINVRQYNCNFNYQAEKLNFQYYLERPGAFYDKRTVIKAKYDLYIKDEFMDEIFTYKDQVLNIQELPNMQNNGLKRGDGYEMEFYSINTFGRIKNCKKLNFDIDINTIILSDGTVMKK